jgi:hypothetical protein
MHITWESLAVFCTSGGSSEISSHRHLEALNILHPHHSSTLIYDFDIELESWFYDFDMGLESCAGTS